MANDSGIDARLGALETRVTELAAALNKAVNDFAPVAGRVSQLSSAFQEANTRLTELETRVNAEPPAAPAEERLAELEQGITGLAERVSTISATAARGPRLGTRLATIEDALTRLSPPPTDGG
jgi:uncharacterized coiled-coil protein SlyX